MRQGLKKSFRRGAVVAVGAVMALVTSASPAVAASGEGAHAGESTITKFEFLQPPFQPSPTDPAVLVPTVPPPCIHMIVEYQGTGAAAMKEGKFVHQTPTQTLDQEAYVGPVDVRWTADVYMQSGTGFTYSDSDCTTFGPSEVLSASMQGETELAKLSCQWDDGEFLQGPPFATPQVVTLEDGKCTIVNKVTGDSDTSETRVTNVGASGQYLPEDPTNLQPSPSEDPFQTQSAYDFVAEDE